MLRTTAYLLSLSAVLLLAAPSPGVAQTPLEPAGVRIDRGSQTQTLQLSITGQRRQYRLEHPIEFSIRGNQDFYLWAYTQDDTGQVVVLVPSAEQSGNRYKAGRTYRLPNPGLNFYADAPGPHEITLVASTRWLDLERSLRRDAQALGGFFAVPSATLEAAFEAQGVRIDRGSRGGGGRSDERAIVVQRIGFEVVR
jgi:hypothetical protein